jgi:zinc resistance-associated protein
MLKPVIAAIATLAIAGSTLVYAQQRFDGQGGFSDGGSRAEHHHHRLSAEDISAFADARIAALKAGLELTPDQAKNWPAYESALRSLTQLYLQHMQARQGNDQQSPTQTPSTPFDRLERRADAMSKSGAALKQLADAGAPLYQSLTDAQKNRFAMLSHMLRPHHHEHAANGGGWRDGRGQDGHGWGPGGRQFGQGGQGWGRGDRQFGQNGRGPDRGMHNSMKEDGDQDSQL